MSLAANFTSLVLLTSAALCGQNEAVYKIRASTCTHKPSSRIQTGFGVAGLEGIVTALHGIVDCETLVASQGAQAFTDLRVAKVDPDADAALLVSATHTANSSMRSFEPASPASIRSYETVRVVGFPYGIALTSSIVTVRDRPMRLLSERLPDQILAAMLTRNSPSIKQTVLDIQGTLGPGDSGGPVLDSQNRVLAMADGGLEGGFAQICWAIPISSIVWRPPKMLAKRLDALNVDGPQPLFATAAAEEEDPNIGLRPGEEIFDNTIFVMPREWTQSKDSDGNLLLRDPSGTRLITIMKSETLHDDFRQAFEKNIQSFASRTAIQAIAAVEGFSVLRTRGIMVVQNQSIGVDYVACHPGNRYEQIGFLNKFGLSQDQEFDQFLASVDYVNSRLARPQGHR